MKNNGNADLSMDESKMSILAPLVPVMTEELGAVKPLAGICAGGTG